MPKIVKPPRAKKATKASPMKGRPITAEEFDRMIEAAPKIVGAASAPSWHRLLRGLWWSGLRLGEALNLTWDDDSQLCVDLSGDFPMLRILAEHEKGNEDRLLPIAPEFADLLLETPAVQRTGLVFEPLSIAGDGCRPSLLWVSKVISAIREKAGIKVATDSRTGKVKTASAHDCRRAFGERWAARVMPPILQQLMRHASIDTTLRYYMSRNIETTAAAGLAVDWKAKR